MTKQWEDLTPQEQLREHMKVVVIFLLFCYVILIYEVYFPYRTLAKVQAGDFKTGCVYVVDKEMVKGKYSTYDKYIIRMDEKEYDNYDVQAGSFFGIQQAKFNQFPINQKYQAFFEINHSQCKPVLYIEMYDFLGFKEFYLYDFIDK